MSARLEPESSPRPSVAQLGRRSFLGTLATTMISCHPSAPAQGRHESAMLSSPLKAGSTPLVVLLAIDGVRHQDVFNGPSAAGHSVARTRQELVPELSEMERHGVALGAPGQDGFHASGPNYVSLPGYMEMLSGTSATGCTENDCEYMQVPTLLDDFQDLAPGDNTRSAAFSSWPNIQAAASVRQSGVVSAGRFAGFHHSVLRRFPQCREALGRGKSDRGGHGHFRHDEITAELALAFLIEAQPDFTFISLGETDEEAHAGDYVGYLSSLQKADRFVGRLRRHLALLETQGRATMLLVTADHGRSRNFRDHGRAHPESSQCFLFAEGSKIRPLGRVATKTSYLRDIAPTLRAACQLPQPTLRSSGRVLEEILV